MLVRSTPDEVGHPTSSRGSVTIWRFSTATHGTSHFAKRMNSIRSSEGHLKFVEPSLMAVLQISHVFHNPQQK